MRRLADFPFPTTRRTGSLCLLSFLILIAKQMDQPHSIILLPPFIFTIFICYSVSISFRPWPPEGRCVPCCRFVTGVTADIFPSPHPIPNLKVQRFILIANSPPPLPTKRNSGIHHWAWERRRKRQKYQRGYGIGVGCVGRGWMEEESWKELKG